MVFPLPFVIDRCTSTMKLFIARCPDETENIYPLNASETTYVHVPEFGCTVAGEASTIHDAAVNGDDRITIIGDDCW